MSQAPLRATVDYSCCRRRHYLCLPVCHTLEPGQLKLLPWSSITLICHLLLAPPACAGSPAPSPGPKTVGEAVKAAQGNTPGTALPVAPLLQCSKTSAGGSLLWR